MSANEQPAPEPQGIGVPGDSLPSRDEQPVKRTRADISRENAQHSTGPRTPEGKARSSRNALKHGMYAESLFIRGEDPSELAEYIATLCRELGVRDEAERTYVVAFASAEWRRRRVERAEASLHHAVIGEPTEPGVFNNTLSNPYVEFSGHMEQIARVSSRCLHQMTTAMGALMRLRTTREKNPHHWEPDPSESNSERESDRYADQEGTRYSDPHRAPILPPVPSVRTGPAEPAVRQPLMLAGAEINPVTGERILPPHLRSAVPGPTPAELTAQMFPGLEFHPVTGERLPRQSKPAEPMDMRPSPELANLMRMFPHLFQE